MGYRSPKPQGKPITAFDEGIPIDLNIESLDFTGPGVQATGDKDVNVSITGGGGTSGEFYDQHFIPTNGQTEFILTFIPSNNSSVFMFVNGLIYFPGKGFTISGVTITWSDDYTISDSDEIVVRYKKAS
jgi:hypothetical protein